MKTVNVAELKDKLSSYLDEVENGEELIVVNRKKPVARLLPLDSNKQDPDEWELVIQGKLRLPAKQVTASYLKRFLSARKPEIKEGSSLDALTMDRSETD
ncbi:type II toxin-antitoxin system prevent-host-death family antitoxin [bacterium]|nr:type II toxin-antitoxin system prevent-host-death family antitoxin [bacterium]MCI0606497.1 type II toxin-antitoxin system prevent-host-death family antitoxin [bacterium]